MMKLSDIESVEIDPYAVDLVVSERLRRLGHQLNRPERREVILRLAGQLTDIELGALLGMKGDAVLKVRERAAVPA
jgi:DNA-directed RNA polymerase specialized sigma24 family protein